SYPPPADIEVRAFLSRPLVGSTCGSAPTISLEPGGPTSVDLPPGLTTGWISVSGGGLSYLVSSNNLDAVAGSVPGSGSPVAICDGCDAAAKCTSLSVPTRMTIGDGAAIRLQSAFASPMWGQLFFFSPRSSTSDAGP
ncbi:MAG: hypothetical protein ACREJ3_10040, partial [Polyangiaceae bacterium]